MSDPAEGAPELSKLMFEALIAYAEEGDAALERLCAEHPESAAALRAVVRGRKPGEQPLRDSVPPQDPEMHRAALERPEWVGPYRILDVLGQGGMGVVYLAEERGPVHRRVALKLIQHGMDSARVLKRFEAERQAMAMMEHENIAKVFFAGATDEGRPFIVMEYIKGIQITEYCDQHLLDVRARIEIFLQVCAGMQHAHQKAVIHRDIKPSNVLVTVQSGKPVAKIIDFGLARAMGHRLHEHTLYTEYGAVVGTPAYMSPEQAGLSALDIDTRSDIYSLGALLYELLTGEPPCLLGAVQHIDEMLRIVREVDPAPPSSRASLDEDRGRLCGSDSRSLRRQLRGDLDWITMKALEKDRTRRYQSASELAADLRCHANHEPVSASPPSTLYRLRKFARKHRTGVAAAAAISLVLAASAVMFGVLWVEADRSRLRSEEQATRAEGVKEILRQMLGPDESEFLDTPREEVKLSQLLAKSVESVDARQASDPKTEAEVRDIIGMAYRTIGHHQQAERQMARAYEIYQRELDKTDERLLGVKLRYAVALEAVGRSPEAGRLLQEVYDARLGGLDAADPTLLHTALSLVINLRKRSLVEDCERLATPTLATARAALGPDSSIVGHFEEALAWCRERAYRWVDAERLHLDAIRIARIRREPTDGQVLRLENNLADFYLRMDRATEAEPLLQQLRAAVELQNGPNHSHSLTVRSNLAKCRYALDDFEAAERLWGEVAEVRRKAASDPADPAVLSATLCHCMALNKLGRREAAERQLREAIPLADKRSPLSTMLCQALGNVLLDSGRTREAVETLRDVLRADGGAIRDPVALANLEIDAAHALLVAGEPEPARELLGAALRRIEGKLPEQHRTMVKMREYLVQAGPVPEKEPK